MNVRNFHFKVYRTWILCWFENCLDDNGIRIGLRWVREGPVFHSAWDGCSRCVQSSLCIYWLTVANAANVWRKTRVSSTDANYQLFNITHCEWNLADYQLTMNDFVFKCQESADSCSHTIECWSNQENRSICLPDLKYLPYIIRVNGQTKPNQTGNVAAAIPDPDPRIRGGHLKALLCFWSNALP